MAPAYAGIGSRRAPPGALARMRAIAAGYARAGWTLRTGGSPGSDQAFLAGALAAGGPVELYLPWAGFEQEALAAAALATAQGKARCLASPSEDARAIAARFHPDWARLGERERALLARDAHEILGAGLDRPAAVAICWTADGSLDGEGLLEDGTGEALRIARAHGVAAVNLHGRA